MSPSKNGLRLAAGLIVVCALGLSGLALTTGTTHSAEEKAAPAAETKAGGEKCCKAGDTTPPIELAKKFAPGELHSPYQDYKTLAKNEELVKQFRLPGCNECHGGGGGFCPALSQGVWFWGNTDDVLFRLIALATTDLEKSGFKRIQFGSVPAPMPAMGHTINIGPSLENHRVHPLHQSSRHQSSREGRPGADARRSGQALKAIDDSFRLPPRREGAA